MLFAHNAPGRLAQATRKDRHAQSQDTCFRLRLLATFLQRRWEELEDVSEDVQRLRTRMIHNLRSACFDLLYGEEMLYHDFVGHITMLLAESLEVSADPSGSKLMRANARER